jgi:hypothetical protein
MASSISSIDTAVGMPPSSIDAKTSSSAAERGAPPGKPRRLTMDAAFEFLTRTFAFWSSACWLRSWCRW